MAEKKVLESYYMSLLELEINGPFLTVNQRMFTEVNLANQWHCRAQNNLCSTLLCEQICEQLTQE